MRKKLIILTIFLVMVSISAVSAADNQTDNKLGDENYNARIIDADDYSAPYQSNDQLQFNLISYDGVYEDTRFDMIDNKTGRVIGSAYYFEDEHCGYGFVEAGVGNYKVTLKLSDFDDSSYNIKPVTINVKITKAPVTLTAEKWVSTTKQYTTLKVTVKDEYGCMVPEGTVKFTINGKSYTVKVKNGVAIKKLKLTNAKTYYYKATFSSQNYKTKTVSSHVYVKKAKRYYVFSIGKYKFKMHYSNYMKLLDAKNNKKYKCVSSVVGKQYGKYPIHMYVDTLPRDMQYKKGDYVHVWIDDGQGMDGYISVKKINLYSLNP